MVDQQQGVTGHYDQLVNLAEVEQTLVTLMARDVPLPPAIEPVDFDTALAAGLRGHFAGDYPAVTAAAHVATAAAGTRVEVALAAGLHGFSVAGDPAAAYRDVWSEVLDDLRGGHDDRGWALARFLVMESALAAARVDLALAAHATGPEPHLAWAGHPIEIYLLASSIRIAVFAGDVHTATSLLGVMSEAADEHGFTELTDAVTCLVTANAATEGTEQLVRALLRRERPSRDALERGAYLLASFAAASLGDKGLAASFVLMADTGPDLAHATIIDRALGFELLVAAAIVVEEPASAQAWLDRLEQLAGHPIAAPPLHRARARVALINGDAAAAVGHAELAVQRSDEQSRAMESAESRIVLARARVALGDISAASSLLRAEVAVHDAHGYRAVRRSATRELRPARRRLPPRIAGGWEVLSDREAEVARMILSGLDQRHIAQELFLSPATVRTHVSRVLAAFGVSSRVALLARLGPLGEPEAKPPLTPRQSEVVSLVAEGRSNAEIAAVLGVHVKAVEKHVGDALARWGVDSRFDLALHWLRGRC